MTTPVTIRRFQPRDAAETRDVFYQAVHVGAAGHYRKDQLVGWVADPAMPDGWGDWLDSHFTVVADAGDRLAGFFMLEASGYLNMAFVRPEYRRTGISDRLYTAILSEAQRLDLPCLTVWASRMARGFLARNGWVMDPAPPPLAGHPVPTDDPEPIDFAMKLDPVPRP